jgi:predicted amino acid-binding ACT domain protein
MSVRISLNLNAHPVAILMFNQEVMRGIFGAETHVACADSMRETGRLQQVKPRHSLKGGVALTR